MQFTMIVPPYVLDKRGQGIVPHKAMLPVGPLAIAAELLRRGHQVRVIDLVFAPNWKKELRGVGVYDNLLLSCHTVRNVGSCKAVLDFLRGNGFRGHVTLGGNACLEIGKDEFADLGLCVDTVLRGYAYERLIEGLETREGGDLVWPTVSKISLPLPAVDLLNRKTLARYLSRSGGRYPIVGHGYGCAWSCGYCTAKMGSNWHARPLEKAADEIGLAYRLGYSHLWCVDNLVLVDPERTIAFDRTVASYSGMTWSGMDRAEQIARNVSTLTRFKALTNLAIGVETVSRRQLQIFGRRERSQDYTFAFTAARNAMIDTTAFVILDCPETDEQDFWKLYQHLKDDLRPTSVSWSFYNPPAMSLFGMGLKTDDYGFYRWPLAQSKTPPERVVQQAMVLDGVWQRGWTLNDVNPFFVNETEFGVHFQEGDILQPYSARSPIGDLWEVWEEETEG